MPTPCQSEHVLVIYLQCLQVYALAHIYMQISWTICIVCKCAWKYAIASWATVDSLWRLHHPLKELHHREAVKFWHCVRDLESPLGELKYRNLATLALQLLSIPASNADSERVFSLVRRIKTDFRSSLYTETLSSLIGCNFNKTWMCCERYKFEESLLTAAKKCTHERNMQYKKSTLAS